MMLPEIDLPDGTLVLIGAGSAPNLDARLSLAGAPARVVLVEPHPATAKALATRFADFAQVSVLALAVSGPAAPEEAVLNTFNDASHSSLRQPLPALTALLPGLKPAKAVTVPVVSAGALMQSLGDLPHPLHLELDAPGAEADILAGLKASGDLARLDSLDLRLGAEALYEGALSAEEVKAWLLAEGFVLQASAAEDPDWPEIRFTFDRAGREAKARLDALVEERDAQRDRIAALEADLAQSEESLGRTRADLTQASTQLTGTLAELTRLREDSGASKSNLSRRIKELETDLADARQEAATAGRRISDLELAQKGTLNWAGTQELLAQNRAERISMLETAMREQREAAEAEKARQVWRIGELEAQLAAAEAKAAQAEAVLRDREDQIARLGNDLQAQEAEIEARSQRIADLVQAQEGTQAWAREQEHLAAQRIERILSLEAELTEARADAAAEQGRVEWLNGELRAWLADAKAALAGSEARLAEQTGANAALIAALSEAERQRDGLGADLGAVRAEAQSLSSALAEVQAVSSSTSAAQAAQVAQQQAEILQLRQDLQLSVRMQALATSDLRALQKKFADTVEIKTQQEALLRQLTPRLQEASSQLRDLMALPSPAEPRMRPALSRAKSGRPRKAAARAASDTLTGEIQSDQD